MSSPCEPEVAGVVEVSTESVAASTVSASSSAPQSDYFKPNKEYKTQSQIDYDIAVKGRSVLSDPNLSIVEQQRYRDALEKKEKEHW